MKQTKRIKLRHAEKRRLIGLKAGMIPLGYIKNRPALLNKFLGAGVMGRLECFSLKYSRTTKSVDDDFLTKE